MLYLLDKNTKSVKWNGLPLYEASAAIVKERLNGEFVLNLRYPITDSKIYLELQEDKLIKAPVPVLGFQLFRIKKPIEQDNEVEVTAYHISNDVLKRSIKPMSIVQQSCTFALSQLVQRAKTNLAPFSFTSDIVTRHTFTTTEVKTLYQVLMDGAHSILGTWEGELIRDNLALSIKKNRGSNRGVILTTHQNLKSFKKSRDSEVVVTRLHLSSTFKTDGAKEERVLCVTVDSPLINQYPYIVEKELVNNDLRTLEELKEWGKRKFGYEGLDKPSESIVIEAHELDGQVVHLGDTVTLKSRKHQVDVKKKAVAYEFDALSQTYLSLTFDDRASLGGGSSVSGVSQAASTILDLSTQTQEHAIERALDNANQSFEAAFTKQETELKDAIERVKAESLQVTNQIKQEVDAKFKEVDKRVRANENSDLTRYQEILEKTKTNTNLASEARNLGNQAKTDAASALAKAISSKAEALKEAEKLLASSKEQLNKQLTTVTQEVNTVKGTLSTKVSSVDFDSLKKTVQGNTTSITQAKQEIQLKAERTLVEEVKKTSTQALNQATLNIKSINQTKAALRVTNDTVETKANRTEFNQLTGRVASAETTIKTQAGEITKRLTSSQVEATLSSKGYQTKADVEKILSTKGYATSTTLQQIVKETSDSFSRRIQETKALIPTDFGGVNLILEGARQEEGHYWNNTSLFTHDFYYKGQKKLFKLLAFGSKEVTSLSNRFKVKRNTKYTLSFWTFSPSNMTSFDVFFLGRKKGENSDYTSVNQLIISHRNSPSKAEYITQTFNSGENDEGYIRFDNNGTTNTSSSFLAFGEVMLVEGTTPHKWAPAPEELVTETRFHQVQDTVASHSRTIGEQGKSISQVLQTANGLVTRIASLGNAQNLVYDPTNYSKYREREPKSNVLYLTTGEYKLLRITQSGLGNRAWRGFQMPLHSQTFLAGETLSYRVNIWVDVLPDERIGFEIKLGSTILGAFHIKPTHVGKSQIFTGSFNIYQTTTKTDDYGLHVWVEKNGQVAIGQISIVRGNQPPTSFVDSTSSEQIATESLVQQHQGSYAIKNLTSAGALISGINLGADGHNRITGRATHITNETLLDRAVIKWAMVDKLKTANFESGSVTTPILAANAVTADKMVVDQAFFNKLMANDAYLRQLFAKSAFINQVQAVTLSAGQIVGGVFRATNNAMRIDMTNGNIKFFTNAPSISREVSGYPHQWVSFETGTSNGSPCGVTVIGSNRWNNWDSNNGGFVGIRAWNGSNDDSIDVVGDTIRLASSAYTAPDGWLFTTLDSGLRMKPYNQSAERNSRIEVGDIWLVKGNGQYSSLLSILNTFNGNFSKGPNADSFDYYPSGF